MARRLIAASILATMGIVAGFSMPAVAATAQCGPHADVLRQLADRFGETVVAAGVTNNAMLVEVLTSERGGTWTLLVRLPDGRACLLAAGQNWRQAEPTVPGTDS